MKMKFVPFMILATTSMNGCAKLATKLTQAPSANETLASCLVGSWEGNFASLSLDGKTDGDLTTLNKGGTGTYSFTSELNPEPTPETFTWFVSDGVLTLVSTAPEGNAEVRTQMAVLCSGNEVSNFVLKGGSRESLVGEWTLLVPWKQIYITGGYSFILGQIEETITLSAGGSATHSETSSTDQNQDGDLDDIYFDGTGDGTAKRETTLLADITWSKNTANELIFNEGTIRYLTSGSKIGLNPFTRVSQ
jgi:hypothetical protein